MLWKLRNLIDYAYDADLTRTAHGRWVPARPLPLPGLRGLWGRIRAAWAVVRGKADAFTWPGGQ